MHNYRTNRIRAVTSVLLSIAVQALAVLVELEVNGWFEATHVIGFILLPVPLLFMIAFSQRRFLPVAPWMAAASTLAITILLWQFPVTQEPRFFARASQIHEGMSVTQVWKQLTPYPMARNNTLPGATLPAEEVALTVYGIEPRFTGKLVCKSSDGSYSYITFSVMDGRVTHIRRQFTLD